MCEQEQAARRGAGTGLANPRLARWGCSGPSGLRGEEIGPVPLRGFFAAWQCCLPGQLILPPRQAAAAETKLAERGTAEQLGPGGC